MRYYIPRPIPYGAGGPKAPYLNLDEATADRQHTRSEAHMGAEELAIAAKLLLPLVTQELQALLLHHKQVSLDALEAEAIAALAIQRAILRSERSAHAAQIPSTVTTPRGIYDGDVLRDGDNAE